MSASQTAAAYPVGGGGILDRERIVASAGFNRWRVPAAALAIHLCIGMSYGLSVFWLPLSRALNGQKPVACPDGSGLLTELFTTTCDWSVYGVSLTFAIGIFFLGSSAALFGGWLEDEGPRKAGVVAACCWAGGFLIGALGIYIHQLWLLWLGLGVTGGIGLGLGYISPVSTLIKWFPDRRGMATGMAIMGFGGGAMIGSPLAALLMNGGDFLLGIGPALGLPGLSLNFPGFKTATTVGVWETFIALAAGYFVYMMIGAFSYRVPPAGWIPAGWTAPAVARAMITSKNVHLDNAHKTPQFWLLWAVLLLNVSAGIGVLGLASTMFQRIFGGALIGKPEVGYAALDASQLTAMAALGAAFAGLLSLLNIGGRFFWASMSDKIGRKTTYFIFFALGFAMYALSPWAAHSGNRALFVLFFCVILSMYGGGFATIPAYLADMFGTQFVGAIHGRLLTAWSLAGILGIFVVGKLPELAQAQGVPLDRIYDYALYILSSFLIVGFIANALVRPVNPRWHMTDAELAEAQHVAGKVVPVGSYGIGLGGVDAKALSGWLIVGVPLLWGVYKTLSLALKLFF